MTNNSLLQEDFFSNDLTLYKNEKVINIFNLFLDYNELLVKKIQFCMEFFEENNFSESDRLHSEIMLVVKNEKTNISKKAQSLLYELCVFYLSNDMNLKAHETMEAIPNSDYKVKALMTYGMKLKKECGITFANVYFSKARKIIDQFDIIKKNIILNKNITEKNIAN
ncbi:MAG: hypothetical protein M0R46_12465 [Candidatus Muirbacterium halophilum]|nr:hypothetical protein [Candidatus Muirbacterium halophilum]MCK9476730.1 hypothetical protein [Candidatus Muirbacterium halophilum]